MAKNKFGFEKNDLKVFRRVLAKMPKLTDGKWKLEDNELRFVTKTQDEYGDKLAFCPLTSLEERSVDEYERVGNNLGLRSGIINAIVAAADNKEGMTLNRLGDEPEKQGLAIREALLLAAFNKLPKGSMPKGYKPQLAAR